jgi:hypothetical protein
MSIRKMMRRGTLVAATTGAVVLGMTGAANASGAGPVAAARPASVLTGPVHIDNAQDCMSYLVTYGYPRTMVRLAACATAQAGHPTADKAVAACTGILMASGVYGIIAVGACLAGM